MGAYDDYPGLQVRVSVTAQQAAEALRIAERAEAAPWTDYPRTPTWYPVAVGAWTAALVATTGLRGVAWRVGALVALVVAEYAFVAWYRSYRGAFPRSAAPAEFRRPMVAFLVGLAVSLVVGLTVAVQLGTWAGVVRTFVGVVVVVAVYERRYAEAAARATRRLA